MKRQSGLYGVIALAVIGMIIMWLLGPAYNFVSIMGAVLVIGLTIAAMILAVRPMKQYMDQLQAQSERHQVALKAAYMGIWHWDITSNIVQWSEEVEHIFGLEPGQFENSYDGYQRRIAPEDVSQVEETIAAALAGKTKEYFIQHRIIRPDGTIGWLEARGKVYRNAQGRPLNMTGTVVDITDYKQAEEAFQDTRRFVESINNTVPGIVYVFNLSDQRNTFANRNMAQMLGYSAQELKAMGPEAASKLMHPEDLTRFPDHLQRFETAPEDAILEFEYRMQAANGRWIWFHSWDTVFSRTAAGSPREILGIAQDITERKNIELELAQAKDTAEAARAGLAQREAYLRSILNNMPFLVWLKDREGRFLTVNQAFADSLNIPDTDSLIGKTDFDVAPLHLAQQYQADDEEVVASRKQKFVEEPIFTSEGQRWFATYKTAILDAHGLALGTTGFAMDITERRQAEEQLKTYAAELERSNRDLQDFAYVASHDLQEPLRKIQAFGNRVQAKYSSQLGENGRDYLARMQHAAARMQTLIQDLLTFSRVHTSNAPFVDVDLNTVVQGVLVDLETRIDEVQGQVKVEPLPTIEAAPSQMRQLFQNLVVNALKFHRQGVPPVVTIEAYTDRQACQITVRDNGIGFDYKHAERIFGVFQRLHGQRVYDGTGVGLAVCRRIVERHHGQIIASGTVDGGATFTITLPLQQRSQA